VIAKRRTDEEDKLFTDLAAIPDPSSNTRVADRLKCFEAAVGLIDTEKAQLQRFQVLLKLRLERLSAEQGDMLRYSLELRLKSLLEKLVNEQKEADAVEAEIQIVQKRLHEISAYPAKAKTTAKA
jgi:dihydroneopterin aldolase